MLAYAGATATRDPSLVCNLHHSSRQRQILNPLGEARNRTCTSWFLVGFVNLCATTGTPASFACLFSNLLRLNPCSLPTPSEPRPHPAWLVALRPDLTTSPLSGCGSFWTAACVLRLSDLALGPGSRHPFGKAVLCWAPTPGPASVASARKAPLTCPLPSQCPVGSCSRSRQRQKPRRTTL